MEPITGTEEVRVESLQFCEEFPVVPPETGSSFTALLELPANEAMSLLHSPETDETPAELPGEVWSNHHSLKVKQESAGSDSNPNSSDLTVRNKNNIQQSRKRKEQEKKGNGSTKKSKSDAEKLPYVHVRARRGQATDSHSLAERARREKINVRMKLLQELVPGCNKISGTAMVLDEIINHVQSLQRQVEFLSMRLAAANPRIDFNLDSLLAAESGSLMDGNFPGLMWPEGQVNGSRQQYQQLRNFDGHHQPVWGREDNPNFIIPENSLLSSFNKFSEA